MNKSQAVPIYTSSKEAAAVYIKGMAAISLLSLLLSRAYLLENTMPFGVAFFGAALLNRCFPIPVLIAAVLGIISIGGLALSYKYMIMLGLVYLVIGVFFRQKALKRHMVSLVIALSILCTSMLWLNLAAHYAPYDVFIVGFEALAGGILVYIFDYAIQVLTNWDKAGRISREDAICTAITIAIAITGLGTLRVWHISIKIVVLAAGVLVSGYTGGVSAGSAAGALLGVTSGLMTTRATAMIGVFSFAGLLSGTFKELGRAGSILGFIIGSAILSFYIDGSVVPVISMEELLAASLLFVVIPGRFLDRLSNTMSLESIRPRNGELYNVRAKEITSVRLKEFAKVFGQLSATFDHVSFKEDFIGSPGLNRLFDGICSRVCKDCSFYKTCWEKEFYVTYQSVFELLSHAEEKGRVEIKNMPPQLRKKCIKPANLIEAVNYLFDLFRINHKWQIKMEECRNLVSQQLDGMGKVIENLAQDIDMRIRFNERLEKNIYNALNKQGVDVSRITVVENSCKRLEVYLDKKSCYGCRECVKKVIPVVSAVTGRKFNKPGFVCNIKNEVCSIKLAEAQKYNATTGICTGPKAESQVSGDNYTFMELREHQYLIALSDGMGTGTQASMESSTTINMLEQLLEVGYDHDLAVKTINSILMLKSPEDSFSTLDITLIDLYTGEAKAIKIGAPPTYIKRGDQVRVVSSSSLPVGIIDRIDFHTKKITLAEGDFIIMVTDGIVDACKGQEKDEWIMDLLKHTNNRNPQEVARIIFEKAMEYYGGQPQDDMTVIVSKVWENI